MLSSSQRDSLKQIDGRYFYEGMDINAEVYIKINNQYVLLCSNAAITSTHIARIVNAINDGAQVYVPESIYNEVLTLGQTYLNISGEPELDEKLIEEARIFLEETKKKLNEIEEYELIIKNTSDIFSYAQIMGRAPTKEVERSVKEIYNEITHNDESLIFQCVSITPKRANYIYSHSTNVAALNGIIGRWMKLNKEEILKLVKIGLLHDIGKFKIPERILNKPGKLTKEEYEEVKKHPIYSYEILKNSEILDKEILSAVKYHHERMNGLGYPNGLKSSAIPLFARITAISDIYSAMVADRPYQANTTPFEVMAEVSSSRFSDLDIKIVNVVLENMPLIFKGKKVIMSDGREGKIISISSTDFAHPVVSIGNENIKTNDYFKCVEIQDFVNVIS